MSQKPFVSSWLTQERAIELVSGRTEKRFGVDPKAHFSGAGGGYLFGRFPLALFAPNECSDRYDGTVDADRARQYASRITEPPPVLVGWPRKGGLLRILDGGHRISAARLRAGLDIPAIVFIQAARLESAHIDDGRGWVADMAFADWQADQDSDAENEPDVPRP